MNKLILKITLILALSFQVTYAQDFLDGAFTFSSKKDSYLTLIDGSEVVGFIDDIDRKKGLIEEITIKVNKKKQVYKPEQIKYMYIAPSGFDKLGKTDRLISDATKWEEDKSAHTAYVKEGYVYFETTEVMVKKKKLVLLLQLLNPGFAQGLKVFFDPYASETTRWGVGGVTLAGGDAKSYYVKKGENVAYKLEKKNYDDEIKNLYGDCPDLAKNFPKMNWGAVEKHVFYYSESCAH